ncbi:MAG: benzoyl-CoA reductase subunit C, partial [Bdellovibrionota bacterium]
MNAPEIIKRCLCLYQDIDLSSVKEWKKQTGKAAIGFFPVYVPKELIHAAGMLPVGLMGAGDQLEIIRGDAYFQSYICHIPRSTIEMAVSGRLDCMDGFLFPAICDVIRNLSGMFQTILKEKYIKYMDYPQNFKRELGGQFYQYEMRDLLNGLSRISGRPITDEAIGHSIRLFNENRRVIEELYELRAQSPHLISAYDLYLLVWSSNVLEVTEHTQMLREYKKDILKNADALRTQDNVRVVVTGAFCEQPPLMMIKSLELSGCYIVDDDWVLGARYIVGDIEGEIEGDIKTKGDPLAALSDAYLYQAVSTASRYEGDAEKGRFLIEQVKKRRAEGVIFCAPSFCDPALLERPMLHEALKAAKIPYTSMKYSENTGQ